MFFYFPKIGSIFVAIIGLLNATTVVNNGKHGYSIIQKHDTNTAVHKNIHLPSSPSIQILTPKPLIDVQNIGSFGILDNNVKRRQQRIAGNIEYNNGYVSGYDNGAGLYRNGYDGKYADYYVS